MAVTLQIARLAPELVEKASNDASVLNEIISFKLSGPGDCIDLNWASEGIEKLAQATLSPEQQSSVNRALKGTTIVNRNHPDGMRKYDVYSDITYLPAADVPSVSAVLAEIDVSNLLRALPPDDDGMRSFLEMTEIPVNAQAFYREQFCKLRDFVQESSKRGLALVMWWD